MLNTAQGQSGHPHREEPSDMPLAGQQRRPSMSLSKNTIWNLAGAGFPLLIGAATVPWLMSRLGVERFGILTLLWAIIGYFSLFDFGLGRALTQQVAACIGGGKEREIPSMVRSGLRFTLIAGMIGAALLAIAAHPLAFSTLNVSPSLRGETRLSLLIAALGIPLATVSAGLRGVIEAYERFLWSNIARIFLGVSIFLFPFIGVWLSGPSLVAVTIWLIISRVASTLVYWIFVRRLPYRKFGVQPIAPGTAKKLLSFGIWMGVSNFISPLLVNADRFVISHMLGAGLVAFYTLPFEFLVRLLILPGAIGTTLLPRLARSHSTDASHIFRKGVKITLLLMAGLAVATSLLAYPVMVHFLAPGFASKALPVVLILSVGVVINGVAYIPYTTLHSMQVARPIGLLHCLELVVYLPMLYAGVKLGGIEGAAVAWVLRAAVDCAGMFYFYRRWASDAL